MIAGPLSLPHGQRNLAGGEAVLLLLLLLSLLYIRRRPSVLRRAVRVAVTPMMMLLHERSTELRARARGGREAAERQPASQP